MARIAPYARILPTGTLVIDGTTRYGELDSEPKLWAGGPYAVFDVEGQSYVGPRMRALWIARLALLLAPAWAFVMGALEFRRACTLNPGPALMLAYDRGRAWAHRVTFGLFDD